MGSGRGGSRVHSTPKGSTDIGKASEEGKLEKADGSETLDEFGPCKVKQDFRKRSGDTTLSKGSMSRRQGDTGLRYSHAEQQYCEMTLRYEGRRPMDT